ncbi:MAG TPA: TlpA disulfide reductase family protein [Candidatus Cloacimonadota bacterium]|nr:TlpA disulfide reductase family protein [Candidatus Cloacimonadota bacterium]
MKPIVLILIILLACTAVLADTMPDFRLPDMNGKNVNLGELLGKGPVLVDFWADYCNPCKVAMPYLHELAEKYDSLTVVLISIDAPKSQSKAKNYLKGKNFKFVTLFDSEKSLAKKLNVSNPPHTFILNPDGEIVYTHLGFEPGTEKEYEHHIRNLLGLSTEAE